MRNENLKTETASLKINSTHVGELMSAIKRNQITIPRFRLNLSAQDALDLLTAHYQVAVEFRHCEFILDENTSNALVKLAQYLTQPNPKFGVLFCGTCGNGKTTLTYALQKTINFLDNRKHFSFLGEYFEVGMPLIDAKELVELSRSPKKFDDIRSRSMLAIDDMGKEPAEVLDFGNVTNPIIDLIEYRYHHQLFTVITTNLDPDMIKKKYGHRVADRFREMLHVIVFQDISYRH